MYAANIRNSELQHCIVYLEQKYLRVRFTTQAKKMCFNQDAPLIDPLWKGGALFAGV